MSSAAASSSKPTKPTRRSKKSAPVSESSGSETDSSEDVTEDEDGVDLTPALDAAILRTLAKIRNKRGVYEGENVLENELKEAEEKVISAGIKAMPNRKEEIKKYTLADHHRAALLNGTAGDEDEEEQEPLTHVESQYKLRNEAVSAFKSLAEESDEEDAEGGLVRREKQEEEVDLDDEEYRRFLLEMGGGEDEVRKILGIGESGIHNVRVEEDEEITDEPAEAEVTEGKKKKKVKSEKSKEKKAKQDDDFLMDYILNRGWIDRSEEKIPTYDEIVGKRKAKAEEEEEDEEVAPKAGGPSHPWGDLDEEDDFDEKAEEFEHAYNFRFEEPGSSNILTHPREIPSLVRRTDDSRATKRAERAERKAAEKAEKEEEARRLKGEKRREMEKQMASLRKDLGIKEGKGEVDWDELEKVMDGDFDEDEWQRVVGKMLEARDDDEEEEEDDNEKPEWDDDVVEMEYEEPEDEEVQMHMTYVPDDDAGYPDEDEGPINMDADFDGEAPTRKRKKNKKGKNKAVEVEEEQAEEENLTVADKAKKVKKAMEEYKALDHEDMIGDMPTRFKYTRSKPTAFGLTPAEILLATDKELDAIAGLRHIAPYRKQGLGMQGRGISKRIYDLKQKLKERKWGEEMEDDEDGKPRTMSRDAGWSGKRKASVDDKNDGGEGSRKKKRLGKSQRKREREAKGWVAPEGGEASAATSSVNRFEAPEQPKQSEEVVAPATGDGEKEGKKRRKKKSSQKQEELKIFD